MVVDWTTESIDAGFETAAKDLSPGRFRSAALDKPAIKPAVTVRAKPTGSKGKQSPASDETPRSSASGDKPKGNFADTIRILVVDDHPLFRHGLVQLLNSEK